MPNLSDKGVYLPPSPIRKLVPYAEKAKSRGIKVYHLNIGQPDICTPQVAVDAVKNISDHVFEYGHSAGNESYRRKLVKYYESVGIDVTADDLMITVGGSEAIFMAMTICLNPGDEVLVPEPFYANYNGFAMEAGVNIKPISSTIANDFALPPMEDFERLITPRTKALILAFPNNPTGAVMEKSDLEAVADVLRGTNIAVISDEIYGELTYEGVHTSIALLDGMRERTIVVGGFSKSHAMTGWRLGYLLAPSELTAQMFKIHQYGIMCAPTTSQFAAVDALAHGDADIEQMKNEYNRRRRLILDGLAACGIACFPPKGAFYVFPEIGTFGLSSEEFCTRLIDEENVALVPGSAFGESGEGFARVSYAYSVRHIEKALERIARFVQRLK